MINTVVFVANRGYALTSSRKSIICLFLARGWNVVLATADDTESRSLVELGAHIEPITFQRGGMTPISDLLAYRRLYTIFEKWQPKLIQQFHAKPVTLGSLAARKVLGNSVRIVNTITGLGHAFVIGGIAASVVGYAYSLAIPKTDVVIFQNRDDKDLFLGKGWVDESQVHQITSSGVDVTKFAYVDRASRDLRSPVIVILSRLIKQKGIPEFVQVAQCIRENIPQAKFIIAGEEEPNHPDGLTTGWAKKQNGIKYVGRLDNVQPLLEQADLFLFPSYYREGVPRVILEASATGLPTVAFDEPGIREAVIDKITGFLVLKRNLQELITKVSYLLENHEKRLFMGLAARKMVETDFDIRDIEKEYIGVYRKLGIKI